MAAAAIVASAGCLEAPASAGSDGGAEPADASDPSVPFAPVSAIAGQLYTYCAVGTGGRVACWGDTEFVHFLDSDISEPNSPVPVLIVDEEGAPITGAVEVKVGATSACARFEDGTMSCWGRNSTAELGQGFKDEDGPHPARPVFNFESVTGIAVGAGHSCAIDNNDLYCWGRDLHGQIGNGGALGDPTVVGAVGVYSEVAEVAAGHYFTCLAESVTGDMWCTGEGSTGQNTKDLSITMFQPAGLPNTRRMSLSSTHGCAFSANGNVACWGRNLNGELGRGTTSEQEFDPLQLTLPDGCVTATDVATGGQSSCMVCEGKAYCWGAGGGGRLGIGSSPSIVPTPTAVAGTQGASDVAVGNTGGCLVSDGEVLCWGSNRYGALGIGLTETELSERAAPQIPVAFDQMQ